MENKNRINITNNGLASISDLKLSAFIRTISPNSFQGINRNAGNKIYFLFSNTREVSEIIDGYQLGKLFTFSPLEFSNNIEQAKALVFGDYMPGKN
ncbi:hypothetical protein A3D00_03145 [Candidatus Woesebacteria bacterium RIFCSPHIGHO2_02_FULL_38_9]|uniref:DUF5659 domain-containing protein n=1 Tax=Candidatus Woesebacteria bacterium RIFCSPHIGHO2_01_FULL_39_28 TaxID=1802496 RepID=A0A1F7YJS7_9BACT|nr:MAG: hypothetical protein A2627_05590 [Candidatus Woesebacteria bacterium RIFCSPHIGHO2_01_FULL_39_28]OGM31467.1 MAG: hypothetical protein A3D00_03145 [Candidatus Woesebacteria bacterium RIFCSPHIGHO2_02_FULL_38_9]OGM56651.1 MAG: hypothetical protein A3A50_04785 [Candidatus Woesebacteria bacterium RIFCSPLOWO2_01_FULL_38_20]